MSANVVCLVCSVMMVCFCFGFLKRIQLVAEHFKLIFPGMAAARRRAAAMPPRENASSLKKESARVAKRCSDFTGKLLHLYG